MKSGPSGTLNKPFICVISRLWSLTSELVLLFDMDPSDLSEKPSEDSAVKIEDEGAAIRAVAFPDNEEIEEKPIRPKGVDMKREMTKEDKELAAAGYEHLEEGKAKKNEKAAGLDANVDVMEHGFTFAELEATLKTSIDTKEPGKSPGLSAEEVSARLARDGRNILTPPKKKSAFRKVSLCCQNIQHTLIFNPVYGLPFNDVQHLAHSCWRAGICPVDH